MSIEFSSGNVRGNRASPPRDQLRQALDPWVLIEQAEGVLMARMGVGADQEFALIRRQARSRSRRVADVAADVIAGHLPNR